MMCIGELQSRGMGGMAMILENIQEKEEKLQLVSVWCVRMSWYCNSSSGPQTLLTEERDLYLSHLTLVPLHTLLLGDILFMGSEN